jgi:hypothetical protein
MNRAWLLLVVLSFTGCVEAQEQRMAQCRVAATSGLTGDQILAGQHTANIRLCMRTHGHEFNETLAGCRAVTEGYLSDQAACYEPAGFFDRALHRIELWVRRQLPD